MNLIGKFPINIDFARVAMNTISMFYSVVQLRIIHKTLNQAPNIAFGARIRTRFDFHCYRGGNHTSKRKEDQNCFFHHLVLRSLCAAGWDADGGAQMCARSVNHGKLLSGVLPEERWWFL